MNLSSNQLRVIVITALVVIAVGTILLVSLGDGREAPLTIPALGQSSDLRSFNGRNLRGVTPSTDPCSLLEKQEVEEELGRSVSNPEGGYVENPLGERFCRFPDPNQPSESLVHLSIVFNGSIDPALLNDDYNVLRMYEGRKASPELIQPIEGLGDDAFWGGSGPELWNGLHVLVHDIYLQVDVALGDEELNYHAARNLAVIALEHLFED